MSNFTKEDNKKGVKANNCHEYLGNNNYKKDNKIYTFNIDGTFTITNSGVFKSDNVGVSTINNNSLNTLKSNCKSHNSQYRNICGNNVHHEKDIPINNYTSHPYQDNNNYDDDNDDKKDFYHKFSDPWKVRNDVENNGHIVSEFGEVFSQEQIKYYKKLGHNIRPDYNFH